MPYDYPVKSAPLTAQQAFDKAVLDVGASYPKRDQVDSLMIDNLVSKGTEAFYVYREYDLPFINGGLGHVYSAPSPLDSDNDGMPDVWEDSNGLNKNLATDALAVSITHAPYLNIEVYINGLVNETPPNFIIPPSNINFTNSTSVEVPPSSSFTVNWNDNSDNEDNFILERSTDGTNFTIIATLSTGIESFDETGLVPNTKYYYRLKATNSTDSSSYSAIASLTTAPIPSAPEKPTTPNPVNGFNFVELTGGNLTLKWLGSANTTTYAVYFGTDSSNLGKLADVAYSVSSSYQVTGLNANTNYFWRIEATNNKGTTASDIWTFKTIANIPQGMVGHWPFMEEALGGEQITDNSSYQNHGILDANYDNTSVRVSGKVNNAIDFINAPTDAFMVNIPNQDQLFFDKSSFSISFWMKAASNLLPTSTTSAYLLCKGSFTKNATYGTTGKRFNVEFKSGELRFAIDDDITKKELKTSATPFFTNNWEHVVVMRDVVAHKLRLYLNGAFVIDLDETGVTGIAEVSDLILGNIGELELSAGTLASPYKGLLDELKIFNYALNTAEVLDLYQNVLLSNEKFSQNKTEIILYPNPINEKINLYIPSYEHLYVTTTITDVTGKVIFRDRIESNGNSRFEFNIANKKLLGVYILNVSGENLNSNLKIIAK